MKWIKNYWYHLTNLIVPEKGLMRFAFYLPFTLFIWATFYYVPFLGVAVIGGFLIYGLWLLISTLFSSL